MGSGHIDIARESSAITTNASVATRLMATTEGVLATATGRSSVDPFTLLPPGVLEGAVEPLLLEEGIAVFTFETAEEAHEVCFGSGAGSCSELIEAQATHFSSWEELGLDGDETPFGEIVEHFAFWTEDGEQFEEDGVFALPDETVVSVNQPGGTRLFTSRDARSWEPIPNIPGVSWITALGEVNGEVAIVAQTPDGPGTSVFRAPGLAGPWTEISIDELLDLPPGDDSAMAWITAATVGEGGVALNLSVEHASGGIGNPIASLARRLLGEEAASPRGAGRSPEHGDTARLARSGRVVGSPLHRAGNVCRLAHDRPGRPPRSPRHRCERGPAGAAPVHCSALRPHLHTQWLHPPPG